MSGGAHRFFPAIQRQPWVFLALALVYLVYAVLPHQHQFTHSHPYAGAFHQHPQQTYHEVMLERQVLGLLGSNHGDVETRLSEYRGGKETVEPASPADKRLYPLSPGQKGWTVTGQAAHTHFVSDANLLALLFSLALLWVFLGLIFTPAWALPWMPVPPLLATGARDPPRS